MSAVPAGCFTLAGGASCFKPRAAIERVPLLQQNSAAGLDARLALLERTNTQGRGQGQGVGNKAAEYRSFDDDEGGGDGTTSDATTTTTKRENEEEDDDIKGGARMRRGDDDETGEDGDRGEDTSGTKKQHGGVHDKNDGSAAAGERSDQQKAGGGAPRDDDDDENGNGGGGGRSHSGSRTSGKSGSKSGGGVGGGGGGSHSTRRRHPKKGATWRAWVITLTIALGPFGTGLAMGYTRAAQGSLLCSAAAAARERQTHSSSSSSPSSSSCPAGSVSEAQLALFENLLLVGAVIGALVGGWSVDAVGRRRALRLMAAPQLAGWLAVLVGPHSGAALIGRVLTGTSAGVTSVAAHTLVAETAPPEMRGQLMALCQLAFAAAVLVQNAFPAVAGASAPHWRMLALGGALYSCVFAAAVGWVPESPRWLVSRGRNVEAVKALAALRGAPDTAVEVEEEANAIINSANLVPPSSSGGGGGAGAGRFYPWHLLTQRQLSRPMLISVALMAFQQLGGIHLTLHSMSYGGGGGGGGGGEEEAISGGAEVLAASALVQVVGCFVCARLLSEGGPGRRTALLVSLVGMTLSNAALAAGEFGRAPDAPAGIASDAAEVVGTLAYAGAWAAGVGTVPWLVAAESFPQYARGAAMGVVAAAHWSYILDLSTGFKAFVAAFGAAAAFAGFAVLCAVGVVGLSVTAPPPRRGAAGNKWSSSSSSSSSQSQHLLAMPEAGGVPLEDAYHTSLINASDGGGGGGAGAPLLPR